MINEMFKQWARVIEVLLSQIKHSYLPRVNKMRNKRICQRDKIRASALAGENPIRQKRQTMSSPRPWSDSEGEVNTSSRTEVRERNESANDLCQGDQQNQSTTNARHTEAR